MIRLMGEPEPKPEAEQGAADQLDPAAVVHLPVLVHSGKVEDLKRQVQSDREGQAAAAGAAVPQAVPNTVASSGAATPNAPSTAAPAPSDSPSRSIQRKLLEGKVIEAIRQVYDPEIPVNLYDLGLIYEIAVADDNSVKVKMTLTAPACPVAGSLPGEVERRIENIPEVKSADVELVWDPPWTRDRMSEAAQLELGLF
jgi:FeS assembly SUF system protein